MKVLLVVKQILGVVSMNIIRFQTAFYIINFS